MIEATRIRHIADLCCSIGRDGPPSRLFHGVHVRLRNSHDVTGVIVRSAYRPGDWIVKWDSDDAIYTINVQQIEIMP